MLVILFPKEFERNLFLLSIGKTNIVYLDTIFKHTSGKIEQECLLIAFKDASNSYDKMFFAIIGVIGTSDVDFNRHFLEFFNKFKASLKITDTWIDRKDSFVFLLAGTCGGSESEKDKIGDCFRIVKAHKFDRGSIVGFDRTGGGCTIKINEDLTLTSEASWNPQSLSSSIAIALSSNFLFNCDPHKYVEHCLPRLHGHNSHSCSSSSSSSSNNNNNNNNSYNNDNYSRFVAEMETYDFFAACKEHDIRSACYRIISDVDGDKTNILRVVTSQLETIRITKQLSEKTIGYYKTQEAWQALHKVGRKSLDMKPLKDCIIEVIGVDHTLNPSPNTSPEFRQSWEQRGRTRRVADAARTIFRGKITPDIDDLKFCDDPFCPDDFTTTLVDSMVETSRIKIDECIEHFIASSKTRKRKTTSQDLQSELDNN